MSTFISIAEAAKLKGYSLRHFRRHVEDAKMRVIEFGNGKKKKHFLLRSHVEAMRCR